MILKLGFAGVMKVDMLGRDIRIVELPNAGFASTGFIPHRAARTRCGTENTNSN